MNYISSNKFSDVSVAIRTQLPLERSTITAYNILVYMLKTKTELFKTKQALISNLNEAYGMKLACGLSSYGADLILTTRIQYIRSDWIEEEDYIHKVKEITETAVIGEDASGNTVSIPAVQVISAFGYKSYNPLEEIAKKYCKEVYVIGGAKQAGGAIPATKEGLEVGLKL